MILLLLIYLLYMCLLIQAWAAEYWTSLGCPAHKLVIGMATYGRGFTINAGNTEYGSAFSGPSAAAQYTREPGYVAYFEVKLKHA